MQQITARPVTLTQRHSSPPGAMVRLGWLLVAPLLALAMALALWVAPTHAQASERGYLGISFNVDGDGFFLNPTLKTVTITTVAPDSPAAKAGIVAGDQIVEIEGRKIAGTKAKDLKPYLDRAPGQTLRLALLKKASGEVAQVTVVLGQRPGSAS